MPDRKNLQTSTPEELPATEEYAPRQYSFRSSAMTTLKITLLGGGAMGVLWLLDMLVTS